MSNEEDQYLLPTNVKPTHYDLTIKTDIEKSVFHGLVIVSLQVSKDTSSITLNSIGLELSNASINSEVLDAEQSLPKPRINDAQQRVTYDLPSNVRLPANSGAQLKIFFSGQLKRDLVGYFKTSWTDKEEGKEKWYALTMFAPTLARRCFPCWDEPQLKATFSLTMISRAGTVNLANMPSISEQVIPVHSSFGIPEFFLADIQSESENWKVTNFEKTPLMSTYIVAFANGEFDFLEDVVVMPLSRKKVPLRVYATKDVVAQAQFTLEVKKVVLPLYEKIFDVEYPLPKLDTLVAHDFVGAMENWGLIVGSMNFLLIDPKNPSVQQKKAAIWMESHEIAHMWFGNITTLEWWKYTYLNEGFATLMGEVIIPTKVYPEWRMNTTFIVKNISSAMTLDAKLSSHPIEVDVPDPNSVVEIFDSLSYSKGASVLRMLSSYIGEDKFLKGVSIYLKKHLFGNTRTHDLWEGISEATGLNITDLMDNWVVKMGFPVLTVTEVESKDGKQGIVIRQDRFLENGNVKEEDNQTIWNIPLAILSTEDGRPVVDNRAILQERSKFFPVNTSQPFKLNAGTNGFFRVLYTPKRLAFIGAEATKDDSIFSLDDRLGLVLDAMALSKAGLAELSSALTLVEQLRNEKEYLVWQGIADNLDALVSTWWEYPEIVGGLNAFRRSLFVPLVEKLGYSYPEDEDSDKIFFRTLAIGQASAAGDGSVTVELTSRFKHYLETGDDSRIPNELQADIFAAAIRSGGRAELEAINKIYDSPKTAQEKLSAIRGISSTQDEILLKETFDFISAKARSQDLQPLFFWLSKNFKARRLLTKHMEDRFEELYEQFQDSYLLPALLSYTINFYSSKEDLAVLEAFFKGKDTSKYAQTIAQAFEGIRARVELIERFTGDLKQWLADRIT